MTDNLEIVSEEVDVKTLLEFWQCFMKIFNKLGYLSDNYVNYVCSKEYHDKVLEEQYDKEKIISVFAEMDNVLGNCLMKLTKSGTAMSVKKILQILSSEEESRDVSRKIIAMWSDER